MLSPGGCGALAAEQGPGEQWAGTWLGCRLRSLAPQQGWAWGTGSGAEAGLGHSREGGEGSVEGAEVRGEGGSGWEV